MFGSEVEAAARAHAAAAYPFEACGIVTDGVYLSMPNEAPDPAETFRLPTRTFADHVVQAVIHSHCADRHARWPTKADMRSQVETAVPWGIVWTNGEQARGPLWFGDFVLDEPLIGRDFSPGICDCYGLVRAWFWQEREIKLPEYPRDDEWWQAGEDMFMQGFIATGFREIGGLEPLRFGDALLMRIHAAVPNHCAIIIDNGLMLHHLAGRLSRREPLGRWEKLASHRLRYYG